MIYKKFFIFMILLVIFSSISALLAPTLLNYWMVNGDSIGAYELIALLVALLIALFVEIILTLFREKFAENFNINNCKNMLRVFFKLPYDKMCDKGPTNLVERIILAVNNMYHYYTGDSIMIWSSVLVVIAILIIVSFNNLLIAGILVLLIPINYFGYHAVNKELFKRSKYMQEATSSGWQEVLSVTNQTDYLKQCSAHDAILEQLTPSLKKIYGSTAKVNVYCGICSKILSSVNQIAQVMLMALVVYQFISLKSGIISLILYSLLLPLYFSNLDIISHANLSKRDMVISKQLIDKWKEEAEADGTIKISSIDSIEFSINTLDIKGKALSSDIYGVYRKGDIIWVKGESGVGKSTLVKCLPKMRQAHEIKINNISIKDITNKSLRKNMRYLSQNVPIIKGTLRDNLFFNKPYDPNIESKLSKEPILQSILKDKDFSTMIGEGGSNLSGGEKQKIAIAREIYEDMDVLILDEITSNIDKESAYSILDYIFDNHKDKIIFIISHDDLPKNYANKVLYMSSID